MLRATFGAESISFFFQNAVPCYKSHFEGSEIPDRNVWIGQIFLLLSWMGQDCQKTNSMIGPRKPLTPRQTTCPAEKECIYALDISCN
jgi:hypothetical protein